MNKHVTLFVSLAFLHCFQYVYSQTSKRTLVNNQSDNRQYLQNENYKEWQRLSSDIILSADGKWISWTTLGSGGSVLFIRNNVSGKTDTINGGSSLSFSANSQWVLYRNENEMYEYRSLSNYIKVQLPLATEAFFSANGSVLITLVKDSFKNQYPKQLVITELATKDKQIIPDVIIMKPDNIKSRLVFNTVKNNQYTTQLLDLNTGETKILLNSAQKLSGFEWSENGKGLIAIKRADNREQNIENVLLLGANEKKSLIKNMSNPVLIAQDSGIIRAVKIGEDGKTLIYRKELIKKTLQPASTIWHWSDSRIEEKIQANIRGGQLPEKVHQLIYNADNGNSFEIYAFSGNDLSSSSQGNYFLLNDRMKYQPQFKQSEGDIYIIDVQKGTQELLVEKVIFPTGWEPPKIAEISPDESYAIFYKENNWWSYNLKDKERQCITKHKDGSFYDTEYDCSGTAPPYGIGGWNNKGNSIYLYDEYDIYEVKYDGSSFKRLTNGREKNIVFRFADKEDSRALRIINPSERLIFSAYGKATGYSGYYELFKNQLKQLMYDNCRYSNFTQAANADVYSFIMQKADASPSLWVKKGSDKLQLVTSTNPQQKKYYWSRSEMISYTSRNGKFLQGALFHPANYVPGKKYPLVVHVYERFSQGLHQYLHPDNFSYSTFNFTQNDYFVFTPDISFEINDPGMSAADCVIPAVEEVIKKEGIDKERLGLMGHSWGGYLTTFIVSQTNLFKAAVAGAPLTDMVSFSLSFRWDNGSTNQLFEGGQARFSGPFYEQQEAYIRNSSVYQSKTIQTPLLLAFGDKDGFVDWHQGIELFNALRRQQKNCWFLHYADKGHQDLPEDYTIKQMEFFNHYLKGHPTPCWMNMPGDIIKQESK